ncbi:MAG: ABC transporter, permease protein (cluster 13, osmolytes) [uncultured Nocardioidaceae bacterium]|uniref:ABC transporter, permease protein (Cluster 13, osmolytes) n=1 Tax=uncultured Nocardioidaceae bacterium TaxID=253824 RepID=A0A6J4NDN3_9ACTN|nr:MAG: ABC transporter, permease protein (cluster 13, osmolytes) [uncultured Nocardioidaceae bacterium]
MGLFDWIGRNSAFIIDRFVEHLQLALWPIVFALALALPAGWLVSKVRWITGPGLAVSGLLYSIPSLALFMFLPSLLPTQLLDPINVVVALTVYAFSLLLRSVVDGLQSVPQEAKIAATALGYTTVGRFLRVELPNAVPVIMTGLRVATVANISLVSVGAFVGTGGLGELFTLGITSIVGSSFLMPPIIVGLVLSVVLALLADVIIVTMQRWLTPWVRAREAST